MDQYLLWIRRTGCRTTHISYHATAEAAADERDMHVRGRQGFTADVYRLPTPEERAAGVRSQRVDAPSRSG